MSTFFTGSEIGFSGSLGFSGSYPYSPQEVYERKEGNEFVFHWDNKEKYIMLLCDNISCKHHRAWEREYPAQEDGFTNCTISSIIVDDLYLYKIPSPMTDMISKGFLLREVIPEKLLDERRKCFKYEETTTSKW